MIKKYRVLLIVFFALFAGVFACCAVFGEYYANRDASIKVNGYQIDFEYDFAMDVNITRLKIKRPDGKSAGLMQQVQSGSCSRLTIQNTGTKIYFLCSGDAISAETDYLDTGTMLLYDGERDETPTPIDSLDFR